MRTLIIDLFVAVAVIGAFFLGRLSTGHPGDTLVPSAALEISRPAAAPTAAPDTATDGRIAIVIDAAGAISGGPFTEVAGRIALELVDRYPDPARLVLERATSDGAPLTVALIELPRPLTGSTTVELTTAGSYRFLLLAADDTLLDESPLEVLAATSP